MERKEWTVADLRKLLADPSIADTDDVIINTGMHDLDSGMYALLDVNRLDCGNARAIELFVTTPDEDEAKLAAMDSNKQEDIAIAAMVTLLSTLPHDKKDQALQLVVNYVKRILADL